MDGKVGKKVGREYHPVLKAILSQGVFEIFNSLCTTDKLIFAFFTLHQTDLLAFVRIHRYQVK